MDAKHILVLAIQLSIMITVFGFGLKTSAAELKDLYRESGLFLRSLLAVFVLMPVVAVLLVRMFELRRPVEIILVALAISPSPPLLPRKQFKAGGSRGYGIELMALLALASIVMVPAGLWFLQLFAGRDLSVAPETIARIVFTSILLPLAAGMLCRHLLPRVADRIAMPLALIGNCCSAWPQSRCSLARRRQTFHTNSSRPPSCCICSSVRSSAFLTFDGRRAA